MKTFFYNLFIKPVVDLLWNILGIIVFFILLIVVGGAFFAVAQGIVAVAFGWPLMTPNIVCVAIGVIGALYGIDQACKNAPNIRTLRGRKPTNIKARE